MKLNKTKIKQSIMDIIPNLTIKSISVCQDGDILKIKGYGHGIYPEENGIEDKITKNVLKYGYRCSYFSSVDDTCTLDKVSLQLDKYE